MPFPKNRLSNYSKAPQKSIANNQWIRSDEFMSMASNTVDLLGSSKRILASSSGLSPGGADNDGIDFSVYPGNYNTVSIIRIPLNRIYTGATGKMRVWLRVKCTDNGTSSSVPAFVRAAISTDSSDTKYLKVNDDPSTYAGEWEWIPLNLDTRRVRTPVLSNDDFLSIRIGVLAKHNTMEQITVGTISAHEVVDYGSPTGFIDTSGANNQIGIADNPLSTAVRRILSRNISSNQRYRQSRTNVFQHDFKSGFLESVSSSYPADENNVGEWIIRKPDGVTTINGNMVYYCFSGDTSIKASLYSIETIDYDNETANFTAGEVIIGQTSGARSRILKVTDSGTTGTLYLSYCDGEFEDNEVIVGDAGGSADVTNSGGVVMQGPSSIGSDEDTNIGGTGPNGYWINVSIGSLISEDAEYILRIAAKETSIYSYDITYSWFFFYATGADAESQAPIVSRFDTDDDIRAMSIKNIKDSLEKVRSENIQLIMTDRAIAGTGSPTGGGTYAVPGGSSFLTSGSDFSGYVAGGLALGELWFTSPIFNSNYGFVIGQLYTTRGANRVTLRASVRRSDSSKAKEMTVTWSAAIPAAYTKHYVYESANGTASGVMYTDGSTTRIFVDKIGGEWAVGDVMSITGSATTATITAISGVQPSTAIDFYLFDGRVPDPPRRHRSIKVVDAAVDRSTVIEATLPSIDAMSDDPTNTGYQGVIEYENWFWGVNIKNTDATNPSHKSCVDYAWIEWYQVFEEPIPPGLIGISEQDTL